MASKRMFSNQITNSDAFNEMPPTAQVLYFHLNMHADDDGFVSSPKRIMRMVGSKDDDYKILIAKRFILVFESGVCVIKHWLIHNLIRADLYKETSYKKEKEMIGLSKNGGYTEMAKGVDTIKEIEAPEWLKKRRGEARTADVPQTVPRLGKDRLGKDSIEQSKEVALTQSGEFKNIKLSQEEITKLEERMGKESCAALVEELSQYIASTGKKYKSHYATLLAWARRKSGDSQSRYQKPVTIIE